MIEELDSNKGELVGVREMFSHVSPYYCDYNATTPLPTVLIEATKSAQLNHWYNASSTYYSGVSETKRIEKIKTQLSRFLPAVKSNSVFCGNASEAISQAIYSLALNLGPESQIVITNSEHPSVKKAAEKYFNDRVIEIPVDKILDNDFECFDKIDNRKKTVFFLQSANNETGIVNPIRKIRHKIGNDAFLLIDASQSFGKQTDFLDLFSVVDGLILSPHKFYGPKGIGILIWSEKLGKLNSLIEGGKQQSGLRGGTENTPNMFVLAEWLKLVPVLYAQFEEVHFFRNEFEKAIVQLNSGSYSLSSRSDCLMNTCSIYIPDVLADELVPALDSIGVMVSSGSACHSGTTEPSASYLALGMNWDKARCIVRFSFGFSNLRLSPLELAQSITKVIKKNTR